MRTYLTYELRFSPTGEGYERLVRMASARAGSVGVALEASHPEESYVRFLDEAAPWLQDQASVFEYPGGISHFPVLRNLYRIDPLLVDLLLRSANGLYEWDFPDLPSDLFFLYPNGDTLLGSVASEDHCYLRLEREEADRWLGEWPASIQAYE